MQQFLLPAIIFQLKSSKTHWKNKSAKSLVRLPVWSINPHWSITGVTVQMLTAFSHNENGWKKTNYQENNTCF